MDNKQIVIFAIVMMIGVIATIFAISNTNNLVNGILMKHKNQIYCYNENTTSRETVIKEKERNSIGETVYQNDPLSFLAEDDWELASELCQSMASQGQFPRDNQDEELELEGTLTLELK